MRAAMVQQLLGALSLRGMAVLASSTHSTGSGSAGITNAHQGTFGHTP